MNIEDYSIHPYKIYRLLRRKNIDFLYHANTVTTSLSFINQKALLSRQFVEANNYMQTTQKSDLEDKKYGVWDDVFLDALDLHQRYKRANYYGPILFKLKLKILTTPSISGIYVTKSNPMYWKENMTLDDKYYSDEQEIEQNYLTGKNLDSQIMFTVKSPDRKIKLKKFLDSIVVDRPRIIIKLISGNKQNVGEYALSKIREALDSNGLRHIPTEFRHKKGIGWCQCQLTYNNEHVWNYKKFREKFAVLK